MTSDTSKASTLKAPRLFVEGALSADATIDLAPKPSQYLQHIRRLEVSAPVRVFNGRDGEWLCRIASSSRKIVKLECIERLKPQTEPKELHYLFAPIKAARLDYIAQKATELGVTHLHPVLTQYTAVRRINNQRLVANTVEAAEQCDLISLPKVEELQTLDAALADWPDQQPLIFCDEGLATSAPLDTLKSIGKTPLGVLIGPEDGFSEDERALLISKPYVTAISLGPRIMCADTAAIAALSLVQASLGDW